MTTTPLAVAQALKALVQSACPNAVVRGFDEDASKPEHVSAFGTIIGERGMPGQPEIDLSPPRYYWNHVFPVEVLGAPEGSDLALDDMLKAIGDGMIANRTLGGLVDYLDVSAPDIASSSDYGSVPFRFASFEFIAQYATSNPLSG